MISTHNSWSYAVHQSFDEGVGEEQAVVIGRGIVIFSFQDTMTSTNGQNTHITHMAVS